MCAIPRSWSTTALTTWCWVLARATTSAVRWSIPRVTWITGPIPRVSRCLSTLVTCGNAPIYSSLTANLYWCAVRRACPPRGSITRTRTSVYSSACRQIFPSRALSWWTMAGRACSITALTSMPRSPLRTSRGVVLRLVGLAYPTPTTTTPRFLADGRARLPCRASCTCATTSSCNCPLPRWRLCAATRTSSHAANRWMSPAAFSSCS